MIEKLLIANRGEIAVRIARTAVEAGIGAVMVYSSDDAASRHVSAGDVAVDLGQVGVAAYLDGARLLEVARLHGCDAVHPGYGFLSENAAFAEACAQAGVTFVGPSPVTLAQFGDKAAARALAQACDMPVLAGTAGGVTSEAAQAFMAGLGDGGAIMLKAVAGGGGRGMRPVERLEDLPAAFERCRSEALQAFGDGSLYAEDFFTRARHVEVQIVGDGSGAVSHLWDRECSLQRQRQKLIEIAPAFGLPEALRAELLAAAVKLASTARYRGLGTIEFLVDARAGAERFVFIEANPRLQVEHTVTEEVLGLDLVRIQLDIAAGASLAELALEQADIGAPKGFALQARVNLETLGDDGSIKPSGGVLSAYQPPTGRGVRVDGYGYPGYAPSIRFDSLLAKLIVQVGGGGVQMAARKADHALSQFTITGAATNIGFLRALLQSQALDPAHLHTRFVEAELANLLAATAQLSAAGDAATAEPHRAGSLIDARDPLAVLGLGRSAKPATAPAAPSPEGAASITAPLQGTIINFSVAVGEEVRKGQPLLVLEAMKMEHVIAADQAGVVRAILAQQGDAVLEGSALMLIEASEAGEIGVAEEDEVDLDAVRPDLAEVLRFHELLEDKARPAAVARRRATGQRTARENIEDLCDPGSFIEYGGLVVSGRRAGQTRGDLEGLVTKTAADGLVMGVGAVNGAQFGAEQARCIAMSYDYSVFAGTQGGKNHQKKDRMFELADRWRLPVVLFAEGGGGRAGGGGGGAVSVGGLNLRAFEVFGRLSGRVPLVGVASGRCFAGNAVLLGCCDVIIATRDSTIGVGGPAMIEGGGLGAYAPEEVGPVSVQGPNGVIDLVVDDEAQATAAARQYLSYFQGRTADWTAPDQRPLRNLVPENRLRVYDVRKAASTLADEGSFLELRREFGRGMVTAFIRIEGRPVGVVANNPQHLGGAIDSDAADKAARFMQLCDAYDIPLLMLCDTPGNMVGPEAEKTGLLRHCSRLYVTGANLTVPVFTVVLRKGYGLGALGMAGGSFVAPFFTVSWPTGEFGGMGLEGQVKLGRRAELLAIKDVAERRARFDAHVAAAYEWGKALNGAMVFEFDDVIDPAETRRWVARGLDSVPTPPVRHEKKRAWIDTW